MDLKESKVENLWRKLNSAEAQSARWDATMLAYFKKNEWERNVVRRAVM